MRDVIVIGAGPAGLTASIYASCYGLNHVVVGKLVGGQLNLAPDILNFPGFKNVKGTELVARMLEQTKQYGAEILEDEVVAIERIEGGFSVKTSDGIRYDTKTLILATGTERRKLNVPGEMEYTGKGVYYSVVVDGVVYENRDVVIIGGGNAGFQVAAGIASQVKSLTILEVASTLRAEKVWMEKLKQDKNVKILTSTKTVQIKGNGTRVSSIVVSINGVKEEIPAAAIFVEIGGVPGTALVAPLGLKLDAQGFIAVESSMATTVEGVFAAGDIVGSGLSLEQLSTAVGLGARAAASAYLYIKQVRAPVVWGKAKINRR